MADFIAGWVGGISVLLVGHPFDTVKVRLQGETLRGVAQRQYQNSFHCARQIVSEEGLRGLYRGVMAPMFGVGIANAALFGVYGQLTSWMTMNKLQYDLADLSGHLQNSTALTVYENCLCAMGGGVAHAIVMTPFEVIKIRLQTSSMFDHRRYYGAIDCGRKLYYDGGVRKLYRGFSATVVRDMPGSIVYFGCYGLLRQVLPQSYDSFNVFSILCAGGVAGVAQWIVIFPFDTVKTRMQIAKEGRYWDSMHVARDLLKTEGITAFYSGITPALMRAFVSNAACFVGVEVALQALRNQ